VSKTAQCPASKPWGVILDATGNVVPGGCHPTKAEAETHMAALYANEPGAKMSSGLAKLTWDCEPCAERAAGPLHYRADVDNSAWDADKAMSQCAAKDDSAGCYGSICAGKKAGDPATQAAHALPHHYPGKGPNAAGTRNALSRLPTTQGLTNEAAARTHLENHMKQINPDYETNGAPDRASAYGSRGFIPLGPARLQSFSGKLRAKPVTRDGQSFYEVEGYASVVDTPYTMYDMFGPYDETVKKGAFDASLERDGLDVAWLVNHKGVTMARTKNQTLELWADSTGLGARAWLNANRQDVRDIVSAIDDGLVDEMSFAFYLTAGGWNEDYDHFTIYEADIHRGDVSAVNYGANPYTSIAARAPEILAALDHLPAGAARAAYRQLAERFGTGATAIEYGRAVMVAERGEPAGTVAGDATVADLAADLATWGIEDETGEDRAAHGAYNGDHAHAHPAYGSQGGDAQHDHMHSHAGDDSHDHQHGSAAPGPAGVPSRTAGPRVMSLSLVMAQQEFDNELDAADA